MDRRLFLGALAAGGVGAVAGCLSGVDAATTMSAMPARVSGEAVEEAGYEYQGTTERAETYRVGGEDVEVTSYNSLYDRAISLPADRFGDEPVRAGAFGVLTTPHVTAGGEEFNPVGGPSNVELAERVQHRYGDLSLERAVGGRALQALGEQFPFQSYGGTATLAGEYDVDIALDILRDVHEDNHLVVVAVYPEAALLPNGSEQGRIDALVRGLEHYEGLEIDRIETDGASG